MPLTREQEIECARLKALFDQRAGMSQRAFAQKHGLGTPANLGQYLLGRRPLSVEMSLKIANALGVDVAEFSPRLADKIDKLRIAQNIEPAREKMRVIPVLADIQAGLPTCAGDISDERCCVANGDYIYVDAEMPDGTFGARVRGESMLPLFKDGDIVVIDPTLRPRPGDFVAAQIVNGEFAEGTFKKYRVVGMSPSGNEVFELVPLNEDFPTLRSDAIDCTVVGVMVEHRRRYRRK